MKPQEMSTPELFGELASALRYLQNFGSTARCYSQETLDLLRELAERMHDSRLRNACLDAMKEKP